MLLYSDTEENTPLRVYQTRSTLLSILSSLGNFCLKKKKNYINYDKVYFNINNSNIKR